MHKITILFLSSVPNDKNHLEVHRECTEIEDGIKLGRNVAMFNLPLERIWEVSVGNLTHKLLEFNSKADVIHFSGHGLKTGIFINGKKGNASFVSADVFRNALRLSKIKARLVVLNTCHSDMQAQAIADIVGCAIGSPESLPDELAIHFSASFYRNLAYDFSIQDAFNLALVDLNLLKLEEPNYPRLFFKQGVDPSNVYLIGRKGRKLIHNIEAWNGFVLVLTFAKHIHHMFQTISALYISDLISKLKNLDKQCNRGSLPTKIEAQDSFNQSWRRYNDQYEKLNEELNSLLPNYRQSIFSALSSLNVADTDNPDIVELVEKCDKSVKTIIGSTHPGIFDTYRLNHEKAFRYMESTLIRELSASESIASSVQDMEQFANALTVTADTLIKQIIYIFLDSGEKHAQL